MGGWSNGMTQDFDSCGTGSIPVPPARLSGSHKDQTDRIVEALKQCNVDIRRAYELSRSYELDTSQLAELFGIEESEVMRHYLNGKRGKKDIYG